MCDLSGSVPEASAEWLRRHFRPESAAGVAAVILVELRGRGGGCVCLQVEDGRLKTSLGDDVAPDVRLAVSVEDWRELLAGRANAEMLAMEGRIRIEGDLGLAMRLRSLFRRTG